MTKHHVVSGVIQLNPRHGTSTRGQFFQNIRKLIAVVISKQEGDGRVQGGDGVVKTSSRNQIVLLVFWLYQISHTAIPGLSGQRSAKPCNTRLIQSVDLE